MREGQRWDLYEQEEVLGSWLVDERRGLVKGLEGLAGGRREWSLLLLSRLWGHTRS